MSIFVSLCVFLDWTDFTNVRRECKNVFLGCSTVCLRQLVWTYHSYSDNWEPFILDGPYDASWIILRLATSDIFSHYILLQIDCDRDKNRSFSIGSWKRFSVRLALWHITIGVEHIRGSSCCSESMAIAQAWPCLGCQSPQSWLNLLWVDQ